MFPYSQAIEAMKEVIESELDARPTHIYDNIDITGQQENLDDLGVAACLIGGTTLHTGLSFAFDAKNYTPLSNQSRDKLRK